MVVSGKCTLFTTEPNVKKLDNKIKQPKNILAKAIEIPEDPLKPLLL